MNAKAVISSLETKPTVSGKHNFHDAEKEYMTKFKASQEAIHAALCDSFNTSAVMLELREIISRTHSYMSSGKELDVSILRVSAKYVTHMLSIFGLFEESSEIGFPAKKSEEKGDVMPYLHVLSGFRDKVRKLAQEKADSKEILKLCDALRDVELFDLGVALDDRPDGTALVKLVDKETLVKQREEKKQVLLHRISAI